MYLVCACFFEGDRMQRPMSTSKTKSWIRFLWLQYSRASLLFDR